MNFASSRKISLPIKFTDKIILTDVLQILGSTLSPKQNEYYTVSFLFNGTLNRKLCLICRKWYKKPFKWEFVKNKMRYVKSPRSESSTRQILKMAIRTFEKDLKNKLDNQLFDM